MTTFLAACQDSFLDVKSDKKLLIPSRLEDFQSLLDDSNVINIAPALGLIASEFYLLNGDYHSMRTPQERNSYIWSDDIYENVPDWTIPYQQVFYANVVLEGLEKLSTKSSFKDELKGRAYFIRANAFFNLVNTFALPYGNGDENVILGIPLPLKGDVNEVSKRVTLLETYEQIIFDFLKAAELLSNTAEYKTRPTKQAAYAMLARVYLMMGDYLAAEQMATSCLNISSELIDFNQLDTIKVQPFPNVLSDKNPEVLYYSSFVGYSYFRLALVDRDVYDLFDKGDLRGIVFFRRENELLKFKGSYSGNNLPLLHGPTTAEIYLLRAECYVKNGKSELALKDLNTLLSKRMKKGEFIPYEIKDPVKISELVLEERQRELVGRGIRWLDLRRFNYEKGHSIVLTREIEGKRYELLPNTKRYAFPIPIEEINRSKSQQN